MLGGDEGRAKTSATASSGLKKMTPGEIRVQKDISELDAGRVGLVEWPDRTDLTSMVLTIKPEQGMWKGGIFQFSINTPAMYPHDPPKVMCLTKIYHPNIDMEGHVCLNILRQAPGKDDGWKPVLDLNAVIYGLIFLMYEPNADDPLNHAAAAALRSDAVQFARTVTATLHGGRIDGVTFPKFL